MPTKSGCGGLSSPNGLCCFHLPFGGKYSEHSRKRQHHLRGCTRCSSRVAPHLAQNRKPISRDDLLVRISILRTFCLFSSPSIWHNKNYNRILMPPIVIQKVAWNQFWFSCQFPMFTKTAYFLQYWYSECMFLSVVVSMLEEYWGVVSSFLASSLELLNGA